MTAAERIFGADCIAGAKQLILGNRHVTADVLPIGVVVVAIQAEAML